MIYLNEIIEIYVDYISKNERYTENTIKCYKKDIKDFCKFLEKKNIKIEDINEKTVEEYTGEIVNKVSLNTYNRKLVALRGFFKLLMSMSICRNKNILKIQLKPAKHKVPEYLTVYEMKQILSKPDVSTKKGVRDKALLELLYATGMKIGELTSLKYNDVDLSFDMVYCSGRSEKRFIPFGDKCKKALKAYIKTDEKKDANDYLFSNAKGNMMSRQGIWKIIRHYADASGIEKDVNPNIIRHSFAVHLINNGIDLSDLKELLGVSSSLSLKLYESIIKNRIKEIYKETHPRA